MRRFALELLVPGDAARPRVDQVPGRKARLLARDRRVAVRLVDPKPERRLASGPLTRLSQSGAIPA